MQDSYRELETNSIRQFGNWTAQNKAKYGISEIDRVNAGVDFSEGTRAAVIDKDQSPVRKPATLAEVSDADVAAYFAPLADGEL
jgi:hypothetical protein